MVKEDYIKKIIQVQKENPELFPSVTIFKFEDLCFCYVPVLKTILQNLYDFIWHETNKQIKEVISE